MSNKWFAIAHVDLLGASAVIGYYQGSFAAGACVFAVGLFVVAVAMGVAEGLKK